MAAAKEAGISKMAAVRKALKELGKDAMPGKIQEYVKEKFGLVMTTAHVSNYKTVISRKKKSKKAPASSEGTSETAVVSVKTVSARSSRVSLGDIEAVRDLVGRVGEDDLKSLIKLLG